MFDIFHTVFKYKEKESPDKLGYFPVRTHTVAMPERRYLWTARALVILSCFSICFNMMLGSTLYLLIPQRAVFPRLFQINKYFSVLELVEPAEVDFPVNDLVVDQHIREYIYLRYTITKDYDELRERWMPGSKIYWYSAPPVYQSFAQNDVAYSITQFREKSLQRGVIIDWVRPLARRVWQVQFQTIDRAPSYPRPVVNVWRATVRIAFVNMNFRKKDDAIINPFGFMIWNYSVAYHGTPETSQNYLATQKEMSEGISVH